MRDILSKHTKKNNLPNPMHNMSLSLKTNDDVIDQSNEKIS